MITWILGGVLIVWCIIKRFVMNNKIEGQPLGMPRGTVRALITLLIVSFPFTYLIKGEPVPRLLIDAIFVLVAFYFQARKGRLEKLKRIVKEIKEPEIAEEEKETEKYPLYIPKYSVRLLLIIIITTIFIINALGPNVNVEATTATMIDLLLIVGLFIVGAFFRDIVKSREKKKFENEILKMDYASLAVSEIIEYLLELPPTWLEQKGKNLLSLAILIAVITSLICFTIEWDYIMLTLPFYEISLRESLLLLVSIYYGFRD